MDIMVAEPPLPVVVREKGEERKLRLLKLRLRKSLAALVRRRWKSGILPQDYISYWQEGEVYLGTLDAADVDALKLHLPSLRRPPINSEPSVGQELKPEGVRARLGVHADQREVEQFLSTPRRPYTYHFCRRPR